MQSYVEPLLNHPTYTFSVGLILVLLYAMYLNYKIHKFTKGQTGASLEKVINECLESVEKMEKTNELILKHAEVLDRKSATAVRNAKVIRYKAFESHGSNQSFSVALLNEEGNGAVITSLHAHDRISTFAKPIENYKSEHELTEEELHVIEESKKEHRK